MKHFNHSYLRLCVTRKATFVENDLFVLEHSQIYLRINDLDKTIYFAILGF